MLGLKNEEYDPDPRNALKPVEKEDSDEVEEKKVKPFLAPLYECSKLVCAIVCRRSLIVAFILITFLVGLMFFFMALTVEKRESHRTMLAIEQQFIDQVHDFRKNLDQSLGLSIPGEYDYEVLH